MQTEHGTGSEIIANVKQANNTPGPSQHRVAKFVYCALMAVLMSFSTIVYQLKVTKTWFVIYNLIYGLQRSP